MPPHIDQLPLDLDISSREGVSLDYMARVRIAYLLGQNQALVTQTQFADAKAGALLAFIGLLATRGPGAVIEGGHVTHGAALLVALHAAAIICCVVVLFPRYASHDVRKRLLSEERFSWPALSARNYGADDFANFMRGSQLAQLVASIARSNHALAGIILSKFVWLRIAFGVAAVDLVVMAARVAFGYV